MGDLRPYIEKALSDFDTVILDSEILLVDDVGCMRSHTHIHCCCDASCSGTVFECLSSTGFSVHSAVYAFPSPVAPAFHAMQTGNLLPFGSFGVNKRKGFMHATVCLFVFDVCRRRPPPLRHV